MYEGRVLIISEFPPPPGGISIQAELLFSKLKGDGVDAAAINISPRLPGQLQRIRFARGAMRFVLFLKKLITQGPRADVFHIFSNSYLNFFIYTCPCAALGRILKKRVIIHYHGGDAKNFMEGYGRIVRRVLTGSACVLVPSEFLKAVFTESGVSSMIMPNILDMRRFRFRQRDPLRPVFIMTRHLEPVYNVECTIKAFAMIKKQFPGARLTIAGDGSQREMLEALCSELQMKDSVLFTGNLDNAAITSFLDEADICLNSSNVDNFPVSILEAFASGALVISSDAGGIPYLIRDGQTGLLFPANDHEAMARRIMEALEGKVDHRAITHEAKESLKKYSWEEIRGGLFCVYGEKGRKAI